MRACIKDGEAQCLLPQILPSGDPKDHLWYWQEYLHRSMHQLQGAPMSTQVTSEPDRERRIKLVAEERSRTKQKWMDSFAAETRSWPGERRAMVRLLAVDVHQGGAAMAYYDSPEHLLFNGVPLDLGLSKSRILELLDGKGVWPDENRFKGGESQVVERLCMGWEECFDANDVPQLLARFKKPGDSLNWSARAALVVALGHLMPIAGVVSDDPNTAEGFLRGEVLRESDSFIQFRAAAELLRINLDVHWPFIVEQFFVEDRGDRRDFRERVLKWLGKKPAGDERTPKLVALISDERFRPFWLEPERRSGKGAHLKGEPSGYLRRYACEALDARFGHPKVTGDDIMVLQDPDQGPVRLQLILDRLHEPEVK